MPTPSPFVAHNATTNSADNSSPLYRYLENLLEELRDQDAGEIASYIPELAKADPNWFGVAICTADGEVYAAGDCDIPFTIQSMSKPFVYGLALEDRGLQRVLHHVGVEPSGESFNSISLHQKFNTPLNPMINAGAIATTGLVLGSGEERRFQRIVNMLGNYMGRHPELDISVYESERSTGHRNRAIAHMLRNFDVLEDDVEESLNVYFRQCSLLVNCRDLAIIGATLANNGTNPVTGVPTLKQEHVPRVLSVMTSCGMYDFAGSWFYHAGIPAKSGVSGGVIGVLPGRLGIGVFSPRLDELGNSVRGVKACTKISQHFGLHLFNTPVAATNVIRHQISLGQILSQRVRPANQSRYLLQEGVQYTIIELQGDLFFSALERVQRAAQAEFNRQHNLILDLRLVNDMDQSAHRMWPLLIEAAAAAGCQLVFTGINVDSPLPQILAELTDQNAASHVLIFKHLDLALEWAEEQLLTELQVNEAQAESSQAEIPLEDLLNDFGFSSEEMEQLVAVCEHITFQAREHICEQGDPSDCVYFLAKGSVSIRLKTSSGKSPRLAAFHPGMAFGELAVIDGGTRSSSVIADTPVVCYRLGISELEELSLQTPNLKIKMLSYFASELARRLRQANREIAALVG